MSFTSVELEATAKELKSAIGDILSKPTKPDLLIGNHPIAAFGSQSRRIASWHGSRIEDHLADWISKLPDWRADKRVRVTIKGEDYEIDNLAWSVSLNLVLAVESKRVWRNQDGSSKRDVTRRHSIYTDPANSCVITSYVGLPVADFRFFVFDAYGATRTGSKGVPVIAGNKIEHVFGRALASYMEWELQVLANAIFEELDHPQSQNVDRVKLLEQDILNQPAGAKELLRQSILDFIDKHSR